jgi:hypothetical protein
MKQPGGLASRRVHASYAYRHEGDTEEDATPQVGRDEAEDYFRHEHEKVPFETARTLPTGSSIAVGIY